MPCHARAEGDQYRCALCRIVWDRNDPEPPKCPQEELEQFEKDKAKSILTKIATIRLPDEIESFDYAKTLP